MLCLPKCDSKFLSDVIAILTPHLKGHSLE